MKSPSKLSALQNTWKQRQLSEAAAPLGKHLNAFARKAIAPRKRHLSELAQAWQELLTSELVEHSSLESYRAGQLRVLVDSAPHLFELDILVKEGLIDKLQEMCPDLPLIRIKLIRGKWYRPTEDGGKVPLYK